jgi:hypothetical protein
MIGIGMNAYWIRGAYRLASKFIGSRHQPQL